MCTTPLRYCTTSTLHFFLYRTPVASAQAQQYCMDLPLVVVVRALFTGWAMGHYHLDAWPLHEQLLGNPIRIVDHDTPHWRDGLEPGLGGGGGGVVLP